MNYFVKLEDSRSKAYVNNDKAWVANGNQASFQMTGQCLNPTQFWNPCNSMVIITIIFTIIQ